MRERLRWPGLALLGLLAGCGPGNGLEMARVRGHVYYKGEPVRSGDILFFVDESKGNRGPSAVGKISQDGTYVLSTEEPGDGAITGHHMVAITGLDPRPVSPSLGQETSPGSTSEAKKGLAIAAAQAKRSKEAVVARGRDLYRIVTPEKLSRPGTSGVGVEVKRGSNSIDFAIQADGSVRVE